MEENKPLAVLIATSPRFNCLIETSLPSIVAQTKKPDVVVIVSDKKPLSKSETIRLRDTLGKIQLVVLENKYLKGAAGSWNTGIDYLTINFPKSFVAIIDDDDFWDTHHLTKCIANSSNAEVVISGINIVESHKVIATNIPSTLNCDDFLIGNPGWQGSNTFISLELLNHAGKFTNGLISCNDRDLAIRVLDLSPSIAFTHQATVYWTINNRDDALSAKRSPQKLSGVCDFYIKYNNRMSHRQKDMFFNRIEHLFEWKRDEIQAEIGNKLIEHRSKPQKHLNN
ncbi:glycosyltransferase family A protein [Pseudoalteromonas sp. G4]|uniref:glycosyltransferase family A protein n=1 Tax=Pseudoalteromonas sp. G4 TaxID=2992761 RepID=UPI00237DB0E0|nr:glycosyltransferase family A protein [Pseudoalteromonas sp. G4]MDE3271396.1 glycosyltransferase family 2 protein [Pseudoalteromonas sp. G4]